MNTCEPVMMFCDDVMIIDEIIQNEHPELELYKRQNRKELLRLRKEFLHKLISDNAPAEPERVEPLLCKECGCKMRWEHPAIPGYVMASSCYIDIDICYDCMEARCAATQCNDCTSEYRKLNKQGDCMFCYLKD